jgi:hypothetical protein
MTNFEQKENFKARFEAMALHPAVIAKQQEHVGSRKRNFRDQNRKGVFGIWQSRVLNDASAVMCF